MKTQINGAIYHVFGLKGKYNEEVNLPYLIYKFNVIPVKIPEMLL